MSKLIAAAQNTGSGFMPLLGTTTAFVALVIIGFVGGASAMIAMTM